jgi:hypothetical protein
MLAKCLRITYEAGEYKITQSYSRKFPGYLNIFINDGYRVEDKGNGWARAIKSSKMILSVSINNNIHEILIDKFFKINLGKLTKKRQNIICNTMPEQVNVDTKKRRDGGNYFVVSENDLICWLQKVKNNL